MKNLLISLLFSTLIVTFVITPSQALTSAPNARATKDFEWVISQIDINAITQHVQYFSGLDSRAPGYVGLDRAAQYIYDQFLNYNLTNVGYHEFSVVAPVDSGANLTILSPEKKIFAIYPFWPNLAAIPATLPDGLSGQLIYAGAGYLAEFDGREVEGSIVLMDINSGRRWLKAAELGAKAVIFIGRDDILRDEARMKVLDTVPFNFPRFYINPQDARYLLSLLETGEVAVNVRSTMKWKVVASKNVVGYVRGENPELYVMLTAHYDSFSYVPSLAPGAEEALGISTLLELARFFSQNPAKYTLVFVAFSGTDLGLHGSRWFVKDWVEGKWNDFGKKIALQINLDLSSESNTPVPTNGGSFYSLMESVGEWWVPIFADFLWSLEDEIERRLGKTWETSPETFSAMMAWHGISWQRIFRGGFLPPLDNEPLVNIDGPGMSITTGYAWRRHWGTPSDTPDKINLNNLKEQLEYIYTVIYAIVNAENLRPQIIPGWSLKYAQTYGAKWVDMSGTIVEYDYLKGWYTPVPNAIFFTRLTTGWYGVGAMKILKNYLANVGLWLYAMSDDEGRVFVPGLTEATRLGGYTSLAYKVNPTGGNIIYAPDFGKYMFLKEMTIDLTSHPFDFGYYTVFKCGSIAVFETFDPSHMNLAEDASIQYYLLNHVTRATPDSWGIARADYGGTGCALMMAHVSPEVPVDVMIRASYAMRYPLALLTNGSDRNPLGFGFSVNAGEQLILTHTPLRYAQDFNWLNEMRIKSLAGRGMIGPFVVTYEKARELIREAMEALNSHNYALAYSLASEAWHLQRGNYVNVRTLIEDTISVAPFFTLLLVPFAFLAERLLFSWDGRKRIVSIALCYVVPLLMLYLYHPGLIMAANALMLLLSSIILILVLPMLVVILGRFQDALKRLKFTYLGRVFGEMAWVDVMITSFSVGSQYIRKRRLISSLSLFSVVLVTTSLVAFTSMESAPTVSSQQVRGVASYDGFILRHKVWAADDLIVWGGAYGEPLPGIGEAVFEYVNSNFGNATICPRAWRYPFPNQAHNYFRLTRLNRTAQVSAILGLTPQEDDLLKVSGTLVEGLWLQPHDVWAAIISEKTAKILNVHPGDNITVSGIPLVVRGVVMNEFFNALTDLDQEMITPRDWKPPATNVHLKVSDVLIIPYETCLNLGGWIVSVSVGFRDPSIVPTYVRDMFLRFPTLRVDYGFKGLVYSYVIGISIMVAGWQFQIVPILLALFTLVNIMLGAVQTRVKELGIYSSIGMSPAHVSLMFLSEHLIFSVVGSLLGYLLGMIACIIGTIYLPLGISLNYSSSWVVYCVSFVMVATLSSASYPAYKVSKIVTPSLERRWKVPAPAGNEWTIPLPFTSSVDRDAHSTFASIADLMTAHMIGRPEDFLVQGLDYSKRDEPGREILLLIADVSLAPYEKGVRQDVQFVDVKRLADGRHTFHIYIERKVGTRSDWITLNRPFLDAFRKRVLTWGFLSVEEKNSYYELFMEIKPKLKE